MPFSTKNYRKYLIELTYIDGVLKGAVSSISLFTIFFFAKSLVYLAWATEVNY